MAIHIVLDATEITKDFYCKSPTFQLLSHWSDRMYGSVWVPASVIEEVVANFDREVGGVAQDLAKVNQKRRRLGLAAIESPADDFDYREYLKDRFDEVLGFNVQPVSEVGHLSLIERATKRIPPFDVRGSGYRDALVWESAKQLAQNGADVVLVSADRIFADDKGNLALVLQEETAGLKIELVNNLSSWLVSRMPWKSSSANEALEQSRAERFLAFFLASDIQSEIWPEIEDLGFLSRPYKVDIEEAEWGGEFDLITSRNLGNGLTLAEYEINESVGFVAEFPMGAQVDDSWETYESFGRLLASGTLEFAVRVAVSYDEDLGFSIESLGWRGKHGRGLGLTPLVDPEIEPIF
jgi:hypothetical protein